MNITQLEAKRRATERQIEQLTAPQRAVAAAAQELSSLEQQIDQARQQAARDATIARLVEHASTGAQALADVCAAQQAFDAAIAPLLAAYTAARERQAAIRVTFYATLAEIAPEARSRYGDLTVPNALLAELEASGADLAGVLACLDGHERAVDRPYDSGHQFPGALQTGLREQFVHQGRHLRPDMSSTEPLGTAAQLLGGT